MNKFIDHQINKYADLPNNLKYETLDYKRVEHRQRCAMLTAFGVGVWWVSKGEGWDD